MIFYLIDRDLRPIAVKKLHHVQMIGQAWFCRTSVCLKTCFAFSCGYQWKFTLTIKTLQAIWTWRHAFWGSTSVFLLCHIGKVCVCLFVFFHHWGLCFLGGHNYSLSRQNGGLIWGFPRWLKRCMGVVTSHCVSLGLLGSKKCVSFFFHFCAKYAHMCIDENLAWFNQSCNFVSTNIHHWPSVYTTFLKFKLNLKYISYSIGNKSTCRFSVIFCQNTLPPPPLPFSFQSRNVKKD